jgi:hypothetical protein
MHSVEELDRKPIGNNMIITKVDPTNFTEIRNFDAEKYRLVREVMPEKIEKLIAYVETLRKGRYNAATFVQEKIFDSFKGVPLGLPGSVCES